MIDYTEGRLWAVSVELLRIVPCPRQYGAAVPILAQMAMRMIDDET